MSDGAIGWRAINFASVLVYLFLFAPIMVTMLLSFNASQFGGFPMTGFSFHWFGVLMNNDIVLAAVRRSLILGSLTATISTVLGIFAATALVRYEFPGKEFVNTLMVAPVLIPETVLATAMRVVNAVPYVVDAPMQATRLTPGGLASAIGLPRNPASLWPGNAGLRTNGRFG